MIRVAVSGGAGRMGRMAAETIAAETDLELAGAYDPHGQGALVAGVTCTTDLSSIDCDVLVDWTTPDAVMNNVAAAAERNWHVVIGTSGFDGAKRDRLREIWSTANGNCLLVPNFSIGAVLMMRFAELAAPHFTGVEVIEAHHEDKADFPSGTALSTAARIAAAGGANIADTAGRGTDVDGVPVHSIRIPGVIASQEVVSGGLGETLSIRHDTFDRRAFMPGMLMAIKGVADLPDKVTVGLDSLLGL
ncbi:MAG: 4-hydroxy-tetrahydrodipicolinate reductase [Acidimicrobiia bacterium]|nr:4-hydroxy-tetrahydrodipicolinate reductase [Acidimicrobiia bacterium]